MTSPPLSIVVLGLLCGLAGCEKRPATWEYISPVLFEPNCATSSCHSRATAADGLDFSDAERGYRSLTDLSATIDGKNPARRAFVTPYQPQQSRLIQMLRARNAPRMPPDRPMPEADILLVEEWILNGAKQHASAPPTFDASTNGDARPDTSQTPDTRPDTSQMPDATTDVGDAGQ